MPFDTGGHIEQRLEAEAWSVYVVPVSPSLSLLVGWHGRRAVHHAWGFGLIFTDHLLCAWQTPTPLLILLSCHLELDTFVANDRGETSIVRGSDRLNIFPKSNG
jgi:hypothetical protein